MLTMTMITAITVVALPQLRITTLSIMRSITLTYVLGAIILILSSQSGVVTLFNESVTVDTMGTYLMIASFVIVSGVLSFYTSRVITTSGTPYTIPILIVIILFGAYYITISGDIITIAVSLEIQSFSLYALTSIYRWREGATSAGLIYFILGAFSSGLVLLGLSIVYAYTGDTVFSSLNILSLLTHDQFITVALIITISGILFKITAAPFHYWGPEVYDRVPTIMTIFINIIPKFALFAFIVRFSSVLSGSDIIGYLFISVVLSWSFGSIVGLVQTRIKRLLAYSTVSHVGWILAAIAVGSTLGFGSFIFYLVQYSATSALTFLSLIALGLTQIMGRSDSDVESITEINGLYSRSIMFTLIIAITLFSAAGIPPIIGFYAKLSVIQALLYNSELLYVIIGVLSSVISAGFYLSVISSILFKVNR